MDCPHIPLARYLSFSQTIHDKAMAKRIPIDGTLEVTFRCNLKCGHCYCVPDPAKRELSFRQICRIIDEVADAGCLWLLITGGEPLVRSDFLDIYTYIKRKGIIVSLFTNGTLITPEIAGHLKKLRPFEVEITLYGATKETYEKVTGVPGSFGRCIRGIELLLELKIPLSLKTVVTTVNKHELPDIKRYVKSLGVSFRFDPVINPRVDGSKEPCRLRISPEEVVQFDLGDEKNLKAWKNLLSDYKSDESEKLFKCAGGLSAFHVDPYGNLIQCVLFRKETFSLLQGTFKDGWDTFYPRLHSQKFTSDSKCRSCEDLPVCDQCPGWGQLEKDDPEFPVEYLCDIARLRAEVLLKKGRRHEEILSKT